MTEPGSPFESPRLLISGATRHRDDFAARLQALQTQEWATLSATDDPGVVHVKISEQAVPGEMKQIAFDFLNNLRSALDHAVYAATVALTGVESDRTKFPIGDTAKEARDNAKRCCGKVPPEMISFLLALEVHRDGNIIVWALNKLRNTKSHRVLVPFATAADVVSPQSGTAKWGGTGTVSASTDYDWNPANGLFKVGMKEAKQGEVSIFTCSLQLHILIGTGTFRGEPALRIFDRMASEVERIVTAIEAETARLLG